MNFNQLARLDNFHWIMIESWSAIWLRNRSQASIERAVWFLTLPRSRPVYCAGSAHRRASETPHYRLYQNLPKPVGGLTLYLILRNLCWLRNSTLLDVKFGALMQRLRREILRYLPTSASSFLRATPITLMSFACRLSLCCWSTMINSVINNDQQWSLIIGHWELHTAKHYKLAAFWRYL